jgi:predicted enzyme related to lactoylglutathione lyase
MMPRVAHFEIHADNPGKAAEFYGNLFGWKMNHLPQLDYWLIDTSEGNEPGINGGIVKRRGPKPTEAQAVNAFVCTATVPSVDTYFAKAQKLGGGVALPKMAIPGVGWVAYCVDPDGNIFGLHEPDTNAK